MKVEKYDPYKKYEKKVRIFSNNEIDSLLNNNSTIKFFLTGFGNEKARFVTNGFRVSPIVQLTKYSKKMMDKASYLPIWAENIDTENYGLELSFLQLPFELNLSVTYSKLDLDKKSRKFAYPPLNPNGDIIDHKLNVYSGNMGFNWIPFMMSFKPALYFDIKNPTIYIYPAVGAIFNYTYFEYYGNKNDYHTIGASAELNMRYRLIFLKAAYRKFLYQKNHLDSQLQLQLGVWFSIND